MPPQFLASKAAVKSKAKVRTAPQGFIGVNFNPWEIQDGGGDVIKELELAYASGAESIRFPLYWFKVQPYSSWSRIPVGKNSVFTADGAGGAPYDWSMMDRLMLRSAELGVSVLPTVMGAPSWASDSAYKDDNSLAMSVPDDYQKFIDFVVRANSRYRSSSTFWSDHQTRPVKIVGWQIWNEPDHPNFWPAHLGEKNGPKGQQLGWAPSYAQLLARTRTALKNSDPGAKALMASLLSVPQTPMAQYYTAGGQNVVDGVASNMFTSPAGILRRMKDFRTYLNAKKNRVPIYLTEFSYLSGKGVWPSKVSMMIDGITDTQAGVGRRAQDALRTLVAQRGASGIAGIYWYSWAGTDLQEEGFWQFAGLRHYTPSGLVDKPARALFAQTALSLEGR